MNRRSLLFAASAGLVVPALLAAPGLAAEGMSKEGPEAYKKKTLEIGAFSKALSEMAGQKAKNQAVKDFANYEIGEQTAVSEVLTNKLDAAPPTFTSEQQATLDKLGKELGDGFDKAYIAAEIEGHHELRKIQEAYLEAHGLKGDDGHIATLAKAVIVMHLDMLDKLKTQFG